MLYILDIQFLFISDTLIKFNEAAFSDRGQKNTHLEASMMLEVLDGTVISNTHSFNYLILKIFSGKGKKIVTPVIVHGL